MNDTEDTATNPVEMESEEAVPDSVQELSELEKYWKTVRDDPSDFTGWTYLLQYVEQEGKIEDAREAFEDFLDKYPYCYGYWKKYADLERKHDNTSKVTQVFADGLRAIPLSIDLWVHYINTMTALLDTDPDKDNKLRELYEKAIAAAGTDFRSDKLWEMYINWEKSNKNVERVVALYDQVTSIPTQLYSHHFENYTQFIKDHHPKDLLSLDDFLRLRRELGGGAKQGVEEEGEEPGGPEEVAPGVEPPPGDDASKPLDDSEVPLLRDRMIEEKTTVHKLNEQEVSKRWAYEEAIRRPYFHVKSLEKAQLRNWKEYLAFEMENGSHERVIVLFERCVIACALYEEFWLKYASYMEGHSVEGVRNIYRRACTIHLTKKPAINLAWAAFEEQQGCVDSAVEVLERLQIAVPDLVMVNLRCISLQRRRKDHASVTRLYDAYMQQAPTPQIHSFYAIKYSRYLSKVAGDVDKALSTLETALERDPTNVKLLLQMVDLEYQGLDEQRVVAVFERAITTTALPPQHRLAFSQRRLEFLEDFAASVDSITKAYNEHQALTKELQTKKRKTPDDAVVDEESKRMKMETAVNGNGETPPTSVQATPPVSAYDASSYNYSQSWPSYPANYNYSQAGWGSYGYYGAQ